MTRLLVSVRDATEAVLALQGGADIIDVKEPRLGSLGAADHATWQAIAEAIGGRVPLSMALGELRDFRNFVESSELPPAEFLRSYFYAKLGLAGCEELANWRGRWQMALGSLPDWITRVAVVYADYAGAYTPDPASVVSTGHELGCDVLLIDTYCKSRGDLFEVCDMEVLRQTIVQAKQCGMLIALAGSLSIPNFTRAIDFGADIVAVRGAVCRGTREGSLDRELVIEARRHLGAYRSP